MLRSLPHQCAQESGAVPRQTQHSTTGRFHPDFPKRRTGSLETRRRCELGFDVLRSIFPLARTSPLHFLRPSNHETTLQPARPAPGNPLSVTTVESCSPKHVVGNTRVAVYAAFRRVPR